MLRIAALPYASLDLATIGYNFASLYYSTLSFGMLSYTKLRLDITLLCHSLIGLTSHYFALLGYNFAILICTPLRFT